MTKFRISTPVPGFNGEVGGCAFAKGVYEGEVGDGPLAYFRAQGYSVEELDETPAEPAEVAEPGDDDGDAVTPPPGNASAEAWREHALAIGATEEQVDGLGRDQLRDLAATIAAEKEQQA